MDILEITPATERAAYWKGVAVGGSIVFLVLVLFGLFVP